MSERQRGSIRAENLSRRLALQRIAAGFTMFLSSACSVNREPRPSVDPVFEIPEFRSALNILEGKDVYLASSFPHPVYPLRAALNSQSNGLGLRLEVVTDEVYLPIHGNYPKKGLILLSNGQQVPLPKIEAMRVDTQFQPSGFVTTEAADKIFLGMEPALFDPVQYRLFMNEPSRLVVLYHNRQLGVHELSQNARKYNLLPTRRV